MHESKFCVECGAENWPYAPNCWLCKRDLGNVDTIVTAELVRPPVSTTANTFFALVCGLLAVVLVLIGIGLFLEEPGSAVGYMIFVVPPLIATIVRTVIKQQRTGYVGWGERLATFVVSGVAFFGILLMLVFAAIVALFIICLMALAGVNQ